MDSLKLLCLKSLQIASLPYFVSLINTDKFNICGGPVSADGKSQGICFLKALVISTPSSLDTYKYLINIHINKRIDK